MQEDLDNFYLSKQEPVKSCLLALKELILAEDPNITTAWKYRMPFFCYKGKMLCYLWVREKTGEPYLGLVDGNKIDHPALLAEKRSRMKIMLFNANKDLPREIVSSLLKQSINIREEN
jgi:hypothetical protein